MFPVIGYKVYIFCLVEMLKTEYKPFHEMMQVYS